MKKRTLTIIPALFLLFSCKAPDIFSNLFKKENSTSIEDVEVDELTKHATSMSVDPKVSFYLKVNEEKDIKVTLSPSPALDEEKETIWTAANDKIKVEVDSKNPLKAKVKGLTAGKTEITCQNVYNPNFKKTIPIQVIDFDEENDYLWQYETSDRAQFGYDNNNAKTGIERGTANLGNMSWNFERSATTSLQSDHDSIGFGKGKEPETLVKLKNINTRKVKKIILETSSANGLANCTVKIGENTVINEKSPEFYDDKFGVLSSNDNLGLVGDISVIFETPEFDSDAYDADPIFYKAPGAVYLKSIYVMFEEEVEPEYKTTSEINFEEIFADPDTYTEFWSGINGTAKEKDYIQDGISYHFDKIKKNNEDGKNTLFNINAPITINAPSGEVISKVEFEYQIFGTASVIYGASGSIVGSDPYSFLLSSGTKGKCSFRVYQPNVNSIRLSSSSTTNVGLLSLVVKTISGDHVEINDVEFPNGAAPTKCNYTVGESFDPTGLASAFATFKDGETADLEIPTNCFKFYDGASFDANPDTATDIMSAESTYVYGVYKDFVCKIEGITVTDVKVIFAQVKSSEELSEGGDFLFVNKTTKSYWKGTTSSGTNMKDSVSVGTLNIDTIGEEIGIPPLVGKEVINISKVENANTYKISTEKLKFGLTATNAFSISGTSSPAFEEWEIFIDNGVVKFKITGDSEKSGSIKYLGFDESNKKFNIYTSEKTNISLYKLIEK